MLRASARRTLLLWQRFCDTSIASTSTASHMMVFDRDLKRQQRDRAVHMSNFEHCQYVKEELAYRTADRIYDCTDFFDVAVDLGAGCGWIAPHIFKENIGRLVQIEMSEAMLNRAHKSDEVPTRRRHADEESVPLDDNSVNLIISATSVHWINDLPGFFARCFKALKEDGAMIISMLGGNTLYELRCSLQLAEQERHGGVAQHMSPFVKHQDLGGLLGDAGFKMITMDSDQLVIEYPHMFALMHDLEGMAEQACSYKRAKTLRRETLVAADAIYREMYAGSKSGTIRATFDVLNAIAWKPGPKMPKPAERGSQTVSLADLSAITENGGKVKQ